MEREVTRFLYSLVSVLGFLVFFFLLFFSLLFLFFTFFNFLLFRNMVTDTSLHTYVHMYICSWSCVVRKYISYKKKFVCASFFFYSAFTLWLLFAFLLLNFNLSTILRRFLRQTNKYSAFLLQCMISRPLFRTFLLNLMRN